MRQSGSRRTLKKHGLSRAQFCKEYGLNFGTLNGFLGGKSISAGMADRITAALDKLEGQSVKAKAVKVATPAPKKSGVTLSKADATLLSEFMETAVCQHVVNQLATDEPRECLLLLHKLTGIYKRLTEGSE